MKTGIGALSLQALVVGVAMTMSGGVDAANVGYYTTPGGCWGGSAAPAITLAGHTPVAVTTLDATSLAALDGLVISHCLSGYPGFAAVDAAVADGLRVMIDSQYAPAGDLLPGNPAILFPGGSCGDSTIPAGSPIATGPGGTLTDTSLDNNGLCGPMDWASVASLPEGGITLVGGGDPTQAVAFAYPQGAGLVAFSTSQWMAALPGGDYSGSIPAANTYYANTVAWMMGAEVTPPTTCASEGYTGTKLLWCQNICEKGYTGATLQTWIHRWVRQFRDLPYCAVESG